MAYTREELSQLSRKELQKLCKQTNGRVKANKKTSDLVNDLAEYYDKEENEMKEMEAEMKVYDEMDLNVTWTVDEEDQEQQSLVSRLSPDTGGMEEQKKEEQGSTSFKLPSDGTSSSNEQNRNDAGIIGEGVAEPLSSENTNEKTTDNFLKEMLMQEVERRAEEKISKIPRLFVADKVKIPSVSHTIATPEVTRRNKGGYGLKTSDSIDVYLAKKQQRAEGQFRFIDSKENQSLASKASLLPKLKRKSVKIDNEITINFTPQVESTPNPGRRVSPRFSSLVKDGVDRRKTFVKPNVSLCSPANVKCQTPTVKTPKFDLKESLKKPLKYKPHTGKLKPVYFNSEQSSSSSLPRKTIPAKMRNTEKKVSVKELNKIVSTRDKRRQDATDKRSKSRNTALDKRRGIMC